MGDTIQVTPKSAGPTLFSPKLTKGKPAAMPSTSASAAYGCGKICPSCHEADAELFLPEHIQTLFKANKSIAIVEYEKIQDLINKADPSIICTPAVKDSIPIPSLRPTYLCLQCPTIMTEEGQDDHFAVKHHVFCTDTIFLG